MSSSSSSSSSSSWMLLPLLILAVVAGGGWAKHVGPTVIDEPGIEGRLDWVYVSNFWVDTYGESSVAVTYKAYSSSLYLAFYNHTEWLDVQARDKCKVRLDVVDTTLAAIPLPRSDGKNATGTVRQRFPKHSTPTWWHVALVDCETASVKGVKYEMSFLNHPFRVLIQQEEFGYDNQHMFEIFAAALLLSLVLAMAHAYGSFVADITYAPLVRRVLTLFRAALACQAGFLVCVLVHLIAYAQNGVGSYYTLVLGLALDFIAYKLMVLFYIIILNEKPEWRPRSNAWAVFVILYILVDLAASVAVYLQYFDVHYASLNLDHPYSTFSGIVRAGLQIVPFAYYIKLVVANRPSHHALSNTQRLLFVMGAVWLMAVPVIAMITLALPAYYQWKMMIGCYLASNAIVLLTMAYFLWPPRANSSFKSNFEDDELRHAIGDMELHYSQLAGDDVFDEMEDEARP